MAGWLAPSSGIPSFAGVQNKTVKAIFARAAERIADGDFFIVNDPNHGAVTHPNDVVLAKPVFHCGILVACCGSVFDRLLCDSDFVQLVNQAA